MSTLRYGEIFDHAWGQIKDKLPLVAGLTLVYFLATSVFSWIPSLGLFMSGFIHAGYVVCLLKIRDSNELSFNDFFWPFLDFNRLLQMALFLMIFSFLIGFGFILLVIPGIYLVVALSLGSLYFVTRKPDAIEAIKMSLHLISNHWWQMFGLLILICLLNIAGAICFGIGLLLSMPMSVFILLRALDVLEKSSAEAPKTQQVSTENPTS